MIRGAIEVAVTALVLAWLAWGIRKSYRMNKRPPEDS